MEDVVDVQRYPMQKEPMVQLNEGKYDDTPVGPMLRLPKPQLELPGKPPS